MGVSEVKAAGYDKLLASRVEGQVSSRRLEGVINHYDLKDAEWSFDAVTHIMDGMNISDYVDLDIELKLRELEEEAQKIDETKAANMGRGVAIGISKKRRKRPCKRYSRGRGP